MTFSSSRSADIRLVNVETPLTPEGIRDLLPWMRTMGTVARETTSGAIAVTTGCAELTGFHLHTNAESASTRASG